MSKQKPHNVVKKTQFTFTFEEIVAALEEKYDLPVSYFDDKGYDKKIPTWLYGKDVVNGDCCTIEDEVMILIVKEKEK